MVKKKNVLKLHFSDKDRFCKVARALSVPARVDILNLLKQNHIVNVKEIAKELGLPHSTTSLHVGVLEEAGLVSCEKMAGIHGTVKMCSPEHDSIYFTLSDDEKNEPATHVQHATLGSYSATGDVVSPCGVASISGPIGVYNDARAFYLPERIHAQVLWLLSGWIEYRFSFLPLAEAELEYLEFSFEACCQANSGENWESEIQVDINSISLGKTMCYCEAQGRRGLLNPRWWPDVATQHGKLFRWRVNDEGTYLNGEKVSDVSLETLHLNQDDFISMKIIVPKNDQYSGGVNLFGSQFGDYPQGIVMTAGYK